MSSIKHTITQSKAPGVGAFIGEMSKMALADLVIDLLRQDAGDEHLDGAALLIRLRAAAEPTARIRGDALPPIDFWERQMVKYHDRMRHNPEQQRLIREAVAAHRPDFVWPS